MPTTINLTLNFTAFLTNWRNRFSFFYKPWHKSIRNFVNMTPKEICFISFQLFSKLFFRSKSYFSNYFVLFIEHVSCVTKVKSSVSDQKTSNLHFSRSEFDEITTFEFNVPWCLTVTFNRIEPERHCRINTSINFIASAFKEKSGNGRMMTSLLQINRTVIDWGLESFS